MYKKPDFEPTRNEMYEILENNIKPISKNEVISAAEACGRICAEDIYSINNLPNKVVSAFDGIAVRFEDFEKGIPDTSSWKEGKEYCFGNTGVAVNEEFDTLIAIEDVEFNNEGKITFFSCPSRKGENIGSVGSQMKEGELLVHKGEKLTPLLIGLLLSSGIVNIKVLSKPKVAFIPTGDELVPAGYEIPLGENVESNSIMLKNYIEDNGGQAIIYPIIKDKFDKLKEAVLSAIQIADLVLICAGSSKGSKDFTIPILESIGKVIVYELGHGPGKHCSFTYSEGIPVMGLPGPPNGAALVSELYVKNALRLMQMQPIQLPNVIEAVLTEDIHGYDFDFIGYMNVTLKEGKYYAKPVIMQGKTRAELYHSHNARFYIKKKAEYKTGEIIAAEIRCAKEYIKEDY
ncbi:molybdopterin molybdotransferase MoeA [Anaerovorax odorimutans]|uniref:molybdopterin molybdotransferase MoeA n=1 Tax=Anaerovorax odorimutans TaxID=109327 RepID=UPI0003F9C424|nr:molybdopterin molybdotransferase MoeA [Anaerovorax odorimutans]